MVLFGGYGSPVLLSDTWKWTSDNWVELHPKTSPSPRAAAQIAPISGSTNHDNHGNSSEGDHPNRYRSTALMFGGFSGNLTSPTFLSDTWKWTSDNWVELHPKTNPSPRAAGNLSSNYFSHDPTNYENVTLFGGLSSSFTSPKFLSDTWEWTGGNWKQITTVVSPPQRAEFGMTFIPDRGNTNQNSGDKNKSSLVLFGGEVANGAVGDTWIFNGLNWLPAGFEADWTSLLSSSLKSIAGYDSDLSDPPTLTISPGIQKIMLPVGSKSPTSELDIVTGKLTDSKGVNQPVTFYYSFDVTHNPMSGTSQIIRGCRTTSEVKGRSIEQECQSISYRNDPYYDPTPKHLEDTVIYTHTSEGEK